MRSFSRVLSAARTVLVFLAPRAVLGSAAGPRMVVGGSAWGDATRGKFARTKAARLVETRDSPAAIRDFRASLILVARVVRASL